ncbi:MAG: 4Fe-4S binding protein [Clostridia bacterium]|nr:4Fe-4S binding protein [Clostridia bacterium]
MNTVEIIFSPTGGTEKVAHIISRQWSESTVKIDLSDSKTDFSGCDINKEDQVLIAMPSFGGRAPAVAIERLKKIAGNGARCTLVCVYGNRAYEDTLSEMEDAAKECGFQVVAAIAAVAQHSIIPQYAANRPDASDEKQLEQFAKQIADKTESVTSVPGNRPYKKAGGAGLVPKPSKDCVKCGVCAKNCPVQAIDTIKLTAASKKCIACMRCVKQCTHHARKVNSAMVSVAAMAIKKACSVRKENELFL